MCGVAVVKKSDRQEQPCGISTAISCSLWNKALTVETSWENSLGIADWILLKALILTEQKYLLTGCVRLQSWGGAFMINVIHFSFQPITYTWLTCCVITEADEVYILQVMFEPLFQVCGSTFPVLSPD